MPIYCAYIGKQKPFDIMDYKELDIWEASVFDFTDDPALLHRFAGNKTKDEYFRWYNFVCRMQHIEKYASTIGDTQLIALASKATAKAWREWSKMAKKVQKKGIIID